MSLRWLYFFVHGRRPPRSERRSPRRGPARDWQYLAWIRTLGCCLCGTTVDVEAAHTGSDGGQSQKASDYSCIPLCHDCHQAAPLSWHRNRAACERRIFERLTMTVEQLVRELNREWHAGRTEAA
jgi:hypothetical protein